MGSPLGAKMPGKWETWPPKWKKRPKWKKAPKTQIPFCCPFFPFWRPFLAISGLGPFSIFFPFFRILVSPFFRDCCVGPVPHAVNGHLNCLKNNIKQFSGVHFPVLLFLGVFVSLVFLLLWISLVFFECFLLVLQGC